MRNDKHLALKLRKAGKSYKYIRKELDIPLSTLAEWFSALAWSKDLKKELTRKANYITHRKFRAYVKQRQAMWEAWREQARQKAREEFPRLMKDPLFLAGIMLYWGEGDSKLANGHVGLTNTSPHMMKLFSLFLTNVCDVSKQRLRGQMILYPDLSEEVCRRFWSVATGIPFTQFYKTQYIKGRHPTKRLSQGIFMIRLGDRRLKEKIAVWIDLFQEQYSSPLADS